MPSEQWRGGRRRRRGEASCCDVGSSLRLGSWLVQLELSSTAPTGFIICKLTFEYKFSRPKYKLRIILTFSSQSDFIPRTIGVRVKRLPPPPHSGSNNLFVSATAALLAPRLALALPPSLAGRRRANAIHTCYFRLSPAPAPPLSLHTTIIIAPAVSRRDEFVENLGSTANMMYQFVFFTRMPLHIEMQSLTFIPITVDDAWCMKTTTDITCGYGIRIGVPLALAIPDGWMDKRSNVASIGRSP